MREEKGKIQSETRKKLINKKRHKDRQQVRAFPQSHGVLMGSFPQSHSGHLPEKNP